MARGAAGPLGHGVPEQSFFARGFGTLLTVAAGARGRGVGPCLLTAVETACTTAELFTSTHISNHPVQHLLRRAGRRPVGLLHGFDEGDPELIHRCPGPRLPGAGATGRRTPG